MANRRIRFEIGDATGEAPVLNAFMGSRARTSVIIGPLGSGKTTGCCQRLLAQMCEQSPNPNGIRMSRWIIIRNAYPELMATTYRTFEPIFHGLGHMSMGSKEPPMFKARFMLKDGTTVQSEIVWLGLDREGAVAKLRGYDATGIWLSEMKEHYKGIVDMADSRIGRYPQKKIHGAPCTWHGVFGDSNAPDEDHWLYHIAEEERPHNWAFFRQPGGVTKEGTEWVPNPVAENLHNLPDGYYENQLSGKREDWIRVNLANEYGFAIEGKPVHPEYQDSVHVSDAADYVPGFPVIVGVDFGRTPSATLLHYLPQVHRWVCFDELFSEDFSVSLFAPELCRLLQRTYEAVDVKAWGDPAGDSAGQTVETTPIEILRAAGIPAQPAPTNNPTIRIAAVARTLTRMGMDAKPGILIHPRCRRLRKALAGGYCYRRLHTAAERYREVPDKNEWSHIADSLQYALVGGGEGAAALRSDRMVTEDKERATHAEMEYSYRYAGRSS